MSHYHLPSLKHMNVNAGTNLDIKYTDDTDSQGAEVNHQCSHHTLYTSSALCNNEILHALDKFSNGRPEASHQFSLCQWLKDKKKSRPIKLQSLSVRISETEVYCTFYPSNSTKKKQIKQRDVKKQIFLLLKKQTTTIKTNDLFLNITLS